MVDNRYSVNAGSVFSLQYHLVWCPKYRKRILVNALSGYTTRFGAPEELAAVSRARDIVRRGRNQS
jgi:REP element-mobilizing transposase RayT